MKLRTRKLKNGERSFFIDYRVDGKRQYKFLRNVGDRKTAEIAFAAFKVQVAKGAADLPSDPGLNLKTCLGHYVDSKRVDCVAGHIKHLDAHAKQIENILGSDTPVKTLTVRDANELKRKLREAKDAPPTINRKLQLLKAAVTLAVKEGWIARNPIESVERLSDRRPPAWHIMSENELNQLLHVLKNGAETAVKRRNGRNYETRIPPQKGMWEFILFLANTGVRKSEALRVCWSDIDFSKSEVRILSTKRAARGGSAEIRDVPLNETLVAALKGLERNGEHVFHPGVNIRRKLQRALKLAGLDTGFRLHDLRHSAASHLLMKGVPPTVVMEIFGWKNLQMVLRYGHTSKQARADSMELLNIGSSGPRADVYPVADVG